MDNTKIKSYKLTIDQFNILGKAISSEGIPTNLKITKKDDLYMYIDLDDDAADELRDCVGAYLQIVGFDDNHTLTKDGKLLESLIDLFYIG